MIRKILSTSFIFLLYTINTNAQVGIGTTTPTSTLDVRGSLSAGYRAFTSSTTAATTDNMLVFTGTSAATLTLPDATACTGRVYYIKNASTTSPTPVLTLATASSQTIDALSSWTLDEPNEVVSLVSNGVNWYVPLQDVPVGKTSTTGGPWNQGGNNLPSMKSIGTITNFSLPIITNNVERMRVDSMGNVAIGAQTSSPANVAEKFLVNAGTTTSPNLVSATGSINNYLQFNIQNTSASGSASSDLVATNNGGSYIDLGINSSGYNLNVSPILNGVNNAYLYTTGNDFIIGDSTAGKNLIFFTGGAALTNERMRINGSGTTSTVLITGSIAMASIRSGTGAYTVLSTDYVVINTGAAATWTLPAASGCTGRIYRLLNHGTGSITLSPAVSISNAGTSTTLIVTAGSNFYEIISDGTVWRRIN